MLDFKFFSDNLQYDYIPLPEDTASWVWDDESVRETLTNGRVRYEIVEGVFHGILDFLQNFPDGYVVIVHHIMGVESGILHDANTIRQGWGFNIQNDELSISFYRILGEED